MKNNRILVIGGAGYVGSHFTLHAANCGLKVTVMDNLSKGHRAALRGNDFIRGDLNEPGLIKGILSEKAYAAIFHFAASCLVGESVSDPAQYYQNNVLAAFNMLEAMRATRHDRLVFSSSCAVYGQPSTLPLKEDHPKDPISPYGRTKLAIEWMLEDYQRAYGVRSASLRYFNAAGCEPSEGLGEDHRPETHLIPNIVRHALKLDRGLTIFGNDYMTPDGTCVRDYIHVTDLAEAHIKAMHRLDDDPLIRLNLGTGAGFSNLELVDAVSRAVGVGLTPKIGPRRPADPPELVADPSAALSLLDWRPSRSDINHIVSEVVQWVSAYPNGYQD